MSYLDTFNSFKNGTALKNPVDAVASQLANLTSQVTNPEAAAVIASITSLTTSTQTAIESMVNNLRTQLPTLTSAEGIEKQLGIGVIEPNGATKTFNDSFAPMFDSTTQLGVIQTTLTPEFIAQLNAGDPSAISSLANITESCTSNLTSSFSVSSLATADGLKTLQADSYAKFVTSTSNPSYVTTVLDQVKDWAV